MMNDCDYSEKVSELMDGALAPEEIDRVKWHLRTCPLCREMHHSFLETRDQLKLLGSSLTPAIDQRVRNRITKASHDPPSIWSRTVRIPIPVAAVLMAVIFGLVIWFLASERARRGSELDRRPESTRAAPVTREEPGVQSDLARFDKGGRAVIYKERRPDSNTAAR